MQSICARATQLDERTELVTNRDGIGTLILKKPARMILEPGDYIITLPMGFKIGCNKKTFDQFWRASHIAAMELLFLSN